MPNRALAFLTILAVVLIIYSCGGDNPTGSQSELESENSVISGFVNAMDDGGGIQDALLELSESNSVVQETYSDDNGEFSFTNVESGQYEVTMTLPQGYRESGTTSKTLQVDNDVSIEFEGEPIKEETATVKAGEQDTVATASGAFVVVNASDASSDMEVTISEISDQNNGEGAGSQPVRIHIRPSGASKSSVSPAQRLAKQVSNSTSKISVSLGQKASYSGPASWVFNVDSDDGPISFYADAQTAEITDPATNYKDNFFTHSISPSTNANIEFRANVSYVDNSCNNDNRKLKPLPEDDSGDRAIILIHGLQKSKPRCDDFDDFKPVDLVDGDEENTFDKLVTKFLTNSEINDRYRIYSYKYPTNAPIEEASDELWNQIEKNDQIHKPVILAHSMGGLVALKMIATEGDEHIGGLITLGTPHKGTPIADYVTTFSKKIEEVCSSNNNFKSSLCAAANLNSGIIFNTPGIRDLGVNSDLIKELTTSDINPDKIFTLGGKLGDISDIYDISTFDPYYKAGFEFMQNLENENYHDNDGLVPLLSAIPDWTSYQAVLEGHDHSEILNGNDFDSNSVFEHLQIILSLLAQDETVTSPTINTITSTPNPSIPEETVSFSADISGDDPIDCEWNFGDGATSTDCNTSYNYPNAGTYDVNFKATNNAGPTDTTFTHIVEQAGVANVIYVNTNATGSNNGTSWSNAFNNLQDALTKAEDGQEIWVVEGTYYPDQGKQQTEGDREATFQLKNGVEIYGGFKGSETARTQRDWKNNITILSGDTGIDDDMSDNSFHVVNGSNTNDSATLNGLTITMGNANDHPDRFGGGMYNRQGSPLIRNVIFKNNEAEGGGAAIFNEDSNPEILDAEFISNFTNDALTGYGGAIYNKSSSPIIKNSSFNNNSVKQSGGAIYNIENSNPLIENCSFIKNNSQQKGGGVYIGENSNPLINMSIFRQNNSKSGGAIYADKSSSTILNTKIIDNSADYRGGGIVDENGASQIVSSIFTGNTAEYGGGIYIDDSESAIINSVFTRNTASFDGGGISVSGYDSNSKIINTILWDNSSSQKGNQLYSFTNSETKLSYSLLEDGVPENVTDEGNNLSSNPLFVDAVGPDNIPGTEDDNLRLQSGSPAINAGLNSVLDLDGDGDTTDDVPVDLDGNTRIQNGTVDMGAYETSNN